MWRGRTYFIVALVTFISAKVLGWLIESLARNVTPGAQDPLHHVAEFLSGEVPYFALLLVLAGVLVAILTEVVEGAWIGGLKQTVSFGFSEMANALRAEVSDLKAPIILAWITNALDTRDHREIGITALKSYYGKHNNTEDNYVDYVLQNFLDRTAIPQGFSREHLVSNINVRKSSLGKEGKDEGDIFQWEETKSFNLICPAGSGVYPLRFHSSSRVRSQNLAEILDNFKVEIAINDISIFDFEEWLEAKAGTFDFTAWARDRNHPPFVGDGVTVLFDGLYLSLRVEKGIPISEVETKISTFERSCIMERERWYSLSMDQPTFNMHLHMHLEGLENWSIKKPTVSASNYHVDAQAFAVIRQPLPSILSVHIPKWTLPGLVFVVEWSPPDEELA